MLGLLRVAKETVSRWETGAQIQQRAMDLLLRLFFDIPEVRRQLGRDWPTIEASSGITFPEVILFEGGVDALQQEGAFTLSIVTSVTSTADIWTLPVPNWPYTSMPRIRNSEPVPTGN